MREERHRNLITFDCYGTLIDFDLDGATRRILGARLSMDGVDEAEFLRDFRVMRFQAVLEPYRPYREVLAAQEFRNGRCRPDWDESRAAVSGTCEDFGFTNIGAGGAVKVSLEAGRESGNAGARTGQRTVGGRGSPVSRYWQTRATIRD